MEEAWMSIGELARATGVPAATLRTWERRYGVPEPVRRPSGHRRYPASSIERLRMAKHAIEAGVRPETALTAPFDAVIRLSGSAAPVADGVPPERLEHVRLLDGERLRQDLARAYAERGALAFATDVAVPFLRAVGDAWAAGDLTVGQEHFASEHLMDLVSREWRQLSQRATGRQVVVAALPGEDHTLALHLAALVLAVHGYRVAFLGRDTPVEDIAAVARQIRARAVVTGVSASARRSPTVRELQALARSLNGAGLVIGSSWRASAVDALWIQGYAPLAHWAKHGEVSR